MNAAVSVADLSKTFHTTARRGGVTGTLRSLVRPDRREVEAAHGLSFDIEPGERVAFVGPNGAGKSTTIKMLSGVLYPTSGGASVLGLTPWADRRALGHRIGTVFGQRSRLWLHLPASDAFDLLARVYGLDRVVYRRRRNELVHRFGVGGLIDKPSRQLSLGERMRCELVASLLHAPSVLFLDEPTIGLDVVAKATLRELVRHQSEAEGTTILLTSHDTSDMEQVCERVLVINEGELLLDRDVGGLRCEYLGTKIVTVLTDEAGVEIDLPGVTVLSSRPHRSVFEIDRAKASVEKVVQEILACCRLRDLTVEDPPMEDVVKAIYAGRRSAAVVVSPNRSPGGAL
ncbi:MAG: ATP-binding cassette domain-containing protein [Dehalococcoidia bacterium]